MFDTQAVSRSVHRAGTSKLSANRTFADITRLLCEPGPFLIIHWCIQQLLLVKPCNCFRSHYGPCRAYTARAV